MRDAMTPDAAVFEPEEVEILSTAFRTLLKRFRGLVRERSDVRDDLAKLVHNVGRSRLQLKKPLRSKADASSLADEAAEVFTYLQQAPESLRAEVRQPGTSKPRTVTLFPTSMRTLPTGALRHQ